MSLAHAADVAPPPTLRKLLERAYQFRSVLQSIKATPLRDNLGWYPYDTLSAVAQFPEAFGSNYDEFLRALRCGPLLDVGCGDGDLSALFASWGLPVTAVDNRPTNFNWMTGVHELRDRLQLDFDILDVDLDTQFRLPETTFGLTVMLGLLYHLKNPFYVLESLAKTSRYCLLSTRIAAVTPRNVNIEEEPLAYLVGPKETNQDFSNYWIFSPAGFVRLANRCGWEVLGQSESGSKGKADPVSADKDRRMFLFLKSRRLSAPARVELSDGWCRPDAHEWTWTLKNFGLLVTAQSGEPSHKFSLRFQITQAMTDVSPVTVSCSVNGARVRSKAYRTAGQHLFEGALPAGINQAEPMRFEFQVQHEFQPKIDIRPLGVIVSLRREIGGISAPIPFWMD